MAAGDATRVWFKDAETCLISRWRDTMTGAELAALAADLTENTTRFRAEHGILPPIYYCRRCETSARTKPPVIHVGGMIFRAKRLGLIGDTEVSRLQALWRRYSASLRRTMARAKTRPCESRERPTERGGCHCRAWMGGRVAAIE